VDELHPGLWFWTAEHPGWTPKDGGPDGWPQVVSCYAVALDESLVLIDPLAPPDGLAEHATAVVITCPAHSRDSARLGVPVYAPGDVLPDGIVAYPTVDPTDLVLWIPEHWALVFGDSLIDRGQGLEIPASWAEPGLTREDWAAALRPLLELPVELALPTHGPPADRAALALALA
jgi:hypothetical protein